MNSTSVVQCLPRIAWLLIDLGLGLFIIHQNIRFQETKEAIKNLIKTSYQELNETKDKFKIWACEMRDATSGCGLLSSCVLLGF